MYGAQPSIHPQRVVCNSRGMENPLDVLSRAATMVETDRPVQSNATLRSNEDLRSEASKELPSRVSRQRRSTERRELAQVLRFDDLHNVGSRTTAATMMDTAAVVSTRCAGTQTEITTMRTEDNDVVGIPEVNPALPTPSTSYLAPSPTHLAAPTGSGKEAQQLRPSVITCAPSQPREGGVREGLCNTNSQTYARTNGYTTSAATSTHTANNHRREISLGVCDPVIEEHFRRSLGKDYKENYGASKATSSAEGVVTMITGSVDDHFAKALGDKWPQIKNVMEPARQSPPSSPRVVHPTSVMSS